MANDEKTEEAAPRVISVKIGLDGLTNTVIKEANILIVAMPLNTPKYQALGFLWTVLQEMTTFYGAIEQMAQARSRGGIIKATASDALALGKSLLKK